jgi:hypothetical protein
MRSRRLMFALIPPNFTDTNPETEYISKFQRLVEYLSKLREKEESQTDLKVEIISRGNKTTNATEDSNRLPRGTTDTMIRFLVQLRKGKRDPFEWTEVAIDSVFDTARSYRISFNWLVASSAKVEAQVQLLHRRCTQYGMQLTPFPQSTISRNLFLNPVSFLFPTCSISFYNFVERLDPHYFCCLFLVCGATNRMHQRQENSKCYRPETSLELFRGRWYFLYGTAYPCMH